MSRPHKNILVSCLILAIILGPNQSAFAFFVGNGTGTASESQVSLAVDYQSTGSLASHEHHDIAKDMQHCKQDKTQCNQCHSCTFCNFVGTSFVLRDPAPDNFYRSQITKSTYSSAITTLYRPPISG